MIHRCLLSLLLTVCVIWPLNAGTGPTKEDIRWAYNYIHAHIANAGDVPVLPTVRQMDFPKGEEYDNLEAITFNKPVTDPNLAFVQHVPKSGFTVVRREFSRTDIRWRGVLIHEMCHWIDFKSNKSGCGCDPYVVQYIYYHEMDAQDLIGPWYNYMVHSPIRICNINMSTLKMLQDKGLHEQQTDQK